MDTLGKVIHDTVGVFTGKSDDGPSHEVLAGKRRREEEEEEDDDEREGRVAGEAAVETGVWKRDWILLTGATCFP